MLIGIWVLWGHKSHIEYYRVLDSSSAWGRIKPHQNSIEHPILLDAGLDNPIIPKSLSQDHLGRQMSRRLYSTILHLTFLVMPSVG